MMLVQNTGSAGGRRRREHLSAECTALRILEFMVANESKGPFTVYRLMRIDKVRCQRRDRIHRMLDWMVEQGWVEAVPGKRTCYRATDEGKKEYPNLRKYIDMCDGLRKLRKVNFVDA